MKFEAQELRNMVWDESDVLTKVEDNIVGTSRWNTENRVVFMYDNRYFCSLYRGAVGDGESDLWEYQDSVECEEVFKQEKTVVVYE